MLSILLSLAMATTPAPPAAACEAAEFHQFDFWIGEWEVRAGAADSKLLGHNTIVRAAAGCALHEHWRGASGFSGMSLNAWDGKSQRWNQFWVGGDGVILRLAGGLENGAMVMRGELPAANGGIQQQRITWTPQADGSVEQRWETSDDAGKTWAVSFLGVYRKAP